MVVGVTVYVNLNHYSFPCLQCRFVLHLKHEDFLLSFSSLPFLRQINFTNRQICGFVHFSPLHIVFFVLVSEEANLFSTYHEKFSLKINVERFKEVEN